MHQFLPLASLAAGLILAAGALANDTAQSALRVYVDPETGALVSTPVTEAQRAAAAADTTFSQDASKTVEAVAADGSKMYILNGQFELATTLRIDADGRRLVECGDAAHAGLEVMEHARAHAASIATTDTDR